MSYETAPATTMLATFCACCSKELVDAVSVEAGVGPECRKKHGYAEAQLDPNWEAVLQETDGIVPVSELGDVRALEAAWRLGGLHTRRIANKLVHRIACDQRGDQVNALTRAIRALGYVKLAARIEHRLASVTIELTDSGYVLKTPYSEDAVIVMRGIPGRRWVGKGREGRNVFPVSSRRPLFEALKRLYPGKTAVGPKGLFTL